MGSRALRRYLRTEDTEATGDDGEGDGESDGGRDSDSDRDRNNDRDIDSDSAAGSVADPLQLASGSITYSLYKWQRDYERGSQADGTGRRHSRARSLSVCESSAMASDAEWELPLSHAQISGPGGFRRHYMHQQAQDEGREPGVVTASFVEFLGLYGHFAGGDYPSDEDDGDEDEDEGGDEGSGQDTRRRESATVAPAAAAPATHGQGASVRKSFFLLIKSFIGSGVLFAPRGFYNGGLAFSAGLMVCVAALSLYTMLLLVRSYERQRCSYGDMARRLYGRTMERVVLFSIVTSQLGFSCAGAIFVATNMRDVFNAATGCRMRLSLDFWVVIQLAPLIPLCLIRHIKGLSSVALLADVFIVGGLAYVCVVDVDRLARLGVAHVHNFNPENYALFLGTAAYTFEGYALILPIVDAMRRPQHFPAVLTLVMVIAGSVAVAIGALSYAAFGDHTEAIILLNMPHSTTTLAVQLAYSLAILFTTPLMMFPVVRILEQALWPRRSGKRNPAVKMQKNAFRTLLLVLVAAVAVAGIDRVDRLVAIIGGFACIPLSFVYPPLFHMRAAATTRYERVRDALLAAAGASVTVWVTWGAVQRWSDSEPPADFCDGV
ncbi:hypothetical protein GGF46_005352 [Coemansia sp. RSA 552]|nr:hypothetical protein GGF46_005352 [Coemansia sp. RSA 552]